MRLSAVSTTFLNPKLCMLFHLIAVAVLLCELEAKLLKVCYIGDYMGEYCRGYEVEC